MDRTARQRVIAAAIPAPALTNRDVMGRTTAGFFLVIGVAGIIFGSAMPAPDSNKLIIVGGSAFSIVMGIGVHILRSRLTTNAHLAFVGLSIVVVTVLIGQAPTVAGDVAIASIYTCITCHAALAFSWPKATVLITTVVIFCLVVGMLDDDMPWWAAVLPATAAGLVGASVTALNIVAREAVFDPLTGLLNRRGLDNVLYVEMEKAATSGQSLALVLFDLDRFKSINDHLGHTAGDQLLKQVAEAWLNILKPGRLLSRYGGDEFALLLPNTSETEAALIADQLRSAASTDCSAGITSWRRGDSASLIIGRADIALYRAKNAGRGRVVVESAERPAIVDSLRHAIETRALAVFFQPIVRISDRGTAEAVAVEALVRWPATLHPDITPEGLVRLAEDNDLISDLGRLVLDLACTQAHQLQANIARPLDLHVNVSGPELNGHAYADIVAAILARTGWPAERLVLEVTETDLAADSRDATRLLAQLRDMGIRIAVDDFGSGYSTLSRVATLPCDILKVDGAIIADTEAAHPLLNAITAIAAAFDLEVIVEGVETREQAALVAGHGIDLSQGYFYARPQPALELRLL
ncbi:putative bifunctional diguanylate cyclase/phosphodiesterase [Antrihabitans stalactiti]|uniref:Bifunctional diguanylate cyclase/phosphodiesterase n=1 Tax=Antrihabitans stalactiti TaxID=2584121 RepID=A0A848KPM0_9NOCA|nr:bifunctional diguanylate cyclase/phosphodiesterase [Antrihabitans stalactiti]NMN98240.1 bifunctional diguanylate cyclase/phosphodiesterase [Antrihabitans stalactiti]